MTRDLKKSFACVGCDYIEVKIGWPCSRCPRQRLQNPDMHSSVNVTNNASGKLKGKRGGGQRK